MVSPQAIEETDRVNTRTDVFAVALKTRTTVFSNMIVSSKE